ncbi:Pr6Pr family membrane protein [Spiroplasma endosymbiont of Ammophila pubescens]|uniref:Pr6Pr family membrane protein n=1 Tax=Spiroplasma endosymbiont of Ammophila pubescens TaxID=3066315 RepID=UPI0032B24245
MIVTDSNNQATYLWAVYDQTGAISHWNYAGYTIWWISFFTTQSNFLVLIWFVIAIICHRQEGIIKLLKTYLSLSVAVYITVTCLIYNFVLLPAILKNKDLMWGPLKWTEQIILHAVVPVLTIIYIVIFANQSPLVLTKQFYRQKLGWYFIYPILYGVYGVIKGILCEYSGMHLKIAYQYFFLQITNPKVQDLPGIVWFIIAIILISGIIAAFGGLYHFSMLKVTKRYQQAKNFESVAYKRVLFNLFKNKKLFSFIKKIITQKNKNTKNNFIF